VSESSSQEQCPVDTHEVFNQPPPLEHYNYFSTDTPLNDAVAREDAGWASDRLAAYGGLVGDQLERAGRLAEKYPPELKTHDRFGHRIDQVEYAGAYHALMRAGIGAGLPSLPLSEEEPGRYVARAAHIYQHHQVDAGSCCPLTMTFAAVPTLRNQPELAEQWLPLMLTRQYDPIDRPWYEKPGITVGMAMTEKQGGTDVRANTTRAVALGAGGGGAEYQVTGHKWFCSAPMSDGFLLLAQAQGGLSCFLMPRWQPDGSRNAIRIQRLKDKLGNHSNASSEVEFRGAYAWLIGEEGRGVANIMEMVALTRFDCIIGSAALMRRALVNAVHHCEYRSVMRRRLLDQPLMRNVLADLALESEAALALGMRLARLLESVEEDPTVARFMRIAIAVGKYWVCRRVPTDTDTDTDTDRKSNRPTAGMKGTLPAKERSGKAVCGAHKRGRREKIREPEVRWAWGGRGVPRCR